MKFALFSLPTRSFAAAGARACMIYDRWDGIGGLLEPGVAVLGAGSVAANRSLDRLNGRA